MNNGIVVCLDEGISISGLSGTLFPPQYTPDRPRASGSFDSGLESLSGVLSEMQEDLTGADGRVVLIARKGEGRGVFSDREKTFLKGKVQALFPAARLTQIISLREAVEVVVEDVLYYRRRPAETLAVHIGSRETFLHLSGRRRECPFTTSLNLGFSHLIKEICEECIAIDDDIEIDPAYLLDEIARGRFGLFFSGMFFDVSRHVGGFIERLSTVIEKNIPSDFTEDTKNRIIFMGDLSRLLHANSCILNRTIPKLFPNVGPYKRGHANFCSNVRDAISRKETAEKKAEEREKNTKTFSFYDQKVITILEKIPTKTRSTFVEKAINKYIKSRTGQQFLRDLGVDF